MQIPLFLDDPFILHSFIQFSILLIPSIAYSALDPGFCLKITQWEPIQIVFFIFSYLTRPESLGAGSGT